MVGGEHHNRGAAMTDQKTAGLDMDEADIRRIVREEIEVFRRAEYERERRAAEALDRLLNGERDCASE